MKRLIPAAVIITLVLILQVTSSRYIQNTCLTAMGFAEQCEEEEIAGKDCRRTLSVLADYWNKKEYGLSFFVNHEKLSGVELQIKSLIEKAEAKEKPLFHEGIKTLTVLLEQIQDDTAIHIKGVA